MKRQTSIHKEDKARIKVLLHCFLPDLFFAPRGELSDDEDSVKELNGLGQYWGNIMAVLLVWFSFVVKLTSREGWPTLKSFVNIVEALSVTFLVSDHLIPVVIFMECLRCQLSWNPIWISPHSNPVFRICSEQPSPLRDHLYGILFESVLSPMLYLHLS